MKNLEKREVCSHNEVRALFAENEVRFARAEQLWLKPVFQLAPQDLGKEEKPAAAETETPKAHPAGS